MIRSLQILCDLVETQSFTETGQRHSLTQPAVSQHLKGLENKFGHRLLERRHRHLALTPAGRVVYETAQDILWRYHRLERVLEKPHKDVSGAIRLVASLTVGLYELPPYLTAYLKQFPKVDMQLNYLPPSEVYDAVLTNHADVGFVAFPEPHPQLMIHLFKKDRLVVVLPRRHPWATRRRISLKRLAKQPFIAMQLGSPMRKAVDHVFEQARVHAHVVHEFDNLELVKRAVEVGWGLSIVPRHTITGEMLANTLIPLEIEEGPFEHPVGIVTRRQAERSLATQKLITLFLSRKGAS